MRKEICDLVFLDSTFRDGTQGFAETVHPKEALETMRMMDDLLLPDLFLEVGFASASRPADIERIRRAKEAGLKAKVTAFGRLDEKDLEEIVSLLPDAATLVGKARLEDAAKKWIVPEGQLEVIASSVRRLSEMVVDRKNGKKMAVLFDAEHFFTAYFSGNGSRAYALKTLRTALDNGAVCAVLCDTTGEMDQNDVREAINGLFEAGFKPQELGAHFHNCRGLALANAEAAFSLGLRHFQGVFGEKIGDNGGNLNLITFILNLYHRRKRKRAIIGRRAMRTLTSLYHSVCSALGTSPDPGAPYVGSLIVRAGMHASGIRKSGVRNYVHFHPESVGNQLIIGLDDSAGGSNIMAWAKSLGVEIASERVSEINAFFRQEIDRGKAYRTYAVDASAGFHVELLVRLGSLSGPFETLFLRTMTEKQFGDEPMSEAHLTIRSQSRGEEFFRQRGDGEVNAAENVLREAWARHCLTKKLCARLGALRFDAYKLQVLSSADGSGSAVRVFCTFTAGISKWSTVGVDENAILASWEALYNGYLYGMLVL